MHAGIHHQAAGPPHLVAQAAKIAVGILVEANLQPQALSIQRPALHEGGEAVEAAEIGQTGQLLLQGKLEVVAGHRFVQRQGFDLVQRPGLEVVGIDIIKAGARPFGRARHIIGGEITRGGKIRDGADAIGQARQGFEQARQLPIHALEHVGGGLKQGLGRIHVEARVAAQEFDELAEAAIEAGLAHNRFHLGADAAHLLQTGLVDGFGRERQGGEITDAVLVKGAPLRQLDGGDAIACGGQVFGQQEIQQRLEARQNRRPDGFLGGPRQGLAVGCAQRGREVQEGLVQHAFGRLIHQLGAQRLIHPGQRYARRDVAGAQAQAHQLDQLANVAGKGLQAGNVGFVIFQRLKRGELEQVWESQVRAIYPRDGHAISMEAQLGNLVIQQAGKDIVVELF